MNLPYSKDLIFIREELEKRVEDFPFLKCQVATRVLHHALGFEEIGGFFEMPDCMEDDWHAWGYDPSRKLYIDLAMDQYKGIALPIHVLPIDNKYLLKDDYRTKQVRNSSDKYLITKYGLEEVIKKVKGSN